MTLPSPSPSQPDRPAPLGLTMLRDTLRALLRKPQAAAPVEGGGLASGLAAAAAFVLLLIGLAFMVDARAARFAATLPASVVKVFNLITALGASGYMFAASAFVAVAASVAHSRATSPRLRAGYEVLVARAVYVFLVVLASGLLAQIVKRIMGRARPKLIDQFGVLHFDFFSWKSSLASFPSGHTTSAFALATALAFLLPRWQGPLLLTACAVGLSRIAVGAHYVSDVLAGVALGTIVAISVARMMARRNLAFQQVDGGLRRRGEGLVGPAIQALFSRRS